MSKHDQLVFRLTEYFDLCDLARTWTVDRLTEVDIAGRPHSFARRSEVEGYRDAAERALRGYCNVLRGS